MKIYHLQNPKCLTIFHTNLTSLKIGTEGLYPTHKMCRSYIIKSMMVSLLKTSKSQIFLRLEQQLLWCIYKSPNSFMSICLCTVVRFFDNTKKHMLKRGVNVVAWTFHLTNRNIFPFLAETHKVSDEPLTWTFWYSVSKYKFFAKLYWILLVIKAQSLHARTKLNCNIQCYF